MVHRSGFMVLRIAALLLGAAIVHAQTTTPSTPSTHDRATALLNAVIAGLREPATAERDARLEGVVADLDKLPAADALNEQFTAHQRMRVYYGSVLQPDGVEKHAGWTLVAAKRAD